MISVLIVDDHGVVRAGLEQLVRTFEGIEVVGTAADGAEAVSRSRELEPVVVLMDIEMPSLDGIAATRAIMAERPGVAVIALTSFSDRRRIVAMLDAGAVGYLLKDASARDLADGIRAAARGESPLDPKAAKALIASQVERSPIERLSAREREVLALIAEGLPNKLIARRLAISEKTVKAHLTSIFRQLGVTDRTQAALLAQRAGVVQGGRP